MKTIQRFLNLKNQLMLVLIFVLLTGSLHAVNLMQYPLATNTVSTPVGGTFSVSSSLTLVTSYGTNGASAYGWNNANQYWLITPISTVGYHTITVSAYMFSQATGPKDFQLQYNVDSEGWKDAGAITLTTTSTNIQIALPAECANKASVQVRWLSTNTSGVASNALSYIKTIRITGNTPTVPDSQTQYISFVSITPTSITVDASPGNGDHRIAVINCVNNFTNPTDDQSFTENSSYNYTSGDHQQVVYVGEGTKFTVTVPSSTNIYYVRYYEYDYNGSMIRYLTPEDTENPKACALETITTNDATAIRLVRATLGATISTPTRSNIQERGIVWSTTSGVTESDHKTIEGGLTGGTFSKEISSLPRGTRIYFKGYVTNMSGTILGDEKYFDNTPIFSGTGTWETAARWNVQEVPGANGDATYGSNTDSPIVNGICSLTSSNEVSNLTINNGAKLTINPSIFMKVDGTLTNNAGVGGLLIKSSSSAPNGSLTFAGGTPQATVEMYSKAYWNLSNPAGSKYAWQYFGIPVSSVVYSDVINVPAYVRAWDESVTDYYDVWARTNAGTSLQLTTSSTLHPNVAYELCQSVPGTYIFTGSLVNADYSQTLQYTSSAFYKGQNMLSNPYTAAMNIADLQFGANTQAAVYLYNTGTFNDWSSSNGGAVPGSGPGTYTVSTPGTAGQGSVPSQIPSMQGFLVKATANPGLVSYSYSALKTNTSKQRVKSDSPMSNMMIDLKADNFTDRMWIFVGDQFTSGFDNGFDGPKMLGVAEVSQLYGVGSDDIYQIDAVKDIDDAVIGLQPGIATNFRLKFSQQNMDAKYSRLNLIDLVTNTVTDITVDGTEYSFTASPSDPVNRFKIVSVTTDVKNPHSETNGFVPYQNGNTLYLINNTNLSGVASVYDCSGRIIVEKQIMPTSQDAIGSLSKGLYVVKINTGNGLISNCVIIK